MATTFNIRLQTLQNRCIKRSAKFALCGIRVGVYNQRDMRMCLSVSVQQVEVLLVDDDGICLGMVKDVIDIFGLQAIIDG